ncbi:MAG: carbon-nitrogen hydrolase [Phycisphaeraceae bacterium]
MPDAPPQRPHTIALLQHACSPQKQKNVDTCVEMIREAASCKAELIVTQELFASRYFCQTEDDRRFALAEPIPGPTSQRLCEVAAELRVSISASLFEKRAAGVYHNTSIMIDPAGKIIDRYRKMHIPDDPRFYEKYYFTPGDLGFRSQTLDSGLRTGMLICWDQWYPEAARLTTLRGAELLLYPTAIGWYTHDASSDRGPGTHGETPETRAAQLQAWQTVQRSHAITNGVYVAACNRIGVEDELEFWGSSFVADPSGAIIAEAPGDQPAVLLAEVDVTSIEAQRIGWPFLRDRRIDAYGEITHRLLD